MVGKAEPAFCPKCTAIVQPGDTVCPNCGAAIVEVSRTLTSLFPSTLVEDSGERFAPGNVFANRYTIIEETGSGGMGRVYKARDRSLGITVALKIIRPEYASNPRIVDHFKKETILARSISSENVVRVHDLGESETIKYISMDFVEGQNLRDLIQASGSLTIPTAVKFGQQICSALSAAHKAGIIHRDLKPSNVMIDKTGRVRVMDFGLAKTLDREDAQRRGAVVGTPEYLSPEQARGESQDQRTDIYALGLILYEMVTGRPVFEAESVTGYIKKHCEANPDPPSRLNLSVPSGLENIILKCLRKKREERFQTAEEVCQSLDAVALLAARLQKAPRTRALRFSIAILGFAAVALAAYFLIVRGRPGSKTSPGELRRKSLAVMSFENVTGDSTRDYLRHLFQNLLMMDLGQSKYLRLISREKILSSLADSRIEDTGVFTSEDLDRIASRENVDYFLLGSYMMSKQKYRLDVRIVNGPQHETVGSSSFDALAHEEIQDRCDEISIWAKDQLGLTRSELDKDFDEELKKYTTRSIEAVIHFSQGLDFYEKGDYRQSIESYKKAVAIDEKFAMAHARLALTYIYEGRFEESDKHLKKAMSLRKNLTPRERLLIEGDYYNMQENDFSRAIETYRNLLLIYPDDEMAYEHLGAIFRNTEEWDKAAECFEHLHAINPNSRVSTLNLSFIDLARGEYDKAAANLRGHEEIFISPAEFYRELAFCYFCQGAINEALLELGKGLSIEPRRFGLGRLLGQIYCVNGNFEQAETSFRQFLGDEQGDRIKIDSHYWLGHLYFLQGKNVSCAREIEEGLRLARRQGFPYEESSFLLLKSLFYLRSADFAKAQEAALLAKQKAQEIRNKLDEVFALHLVGLCEVGQGKLPEAKKTSEIMRQIVGKMGYQKLFRHCYHLEGMAALAQGSLSEAAARFSDAVATLPYQHLEYDEPQAFYLESLASALLQLGDLDIARAQYEKIVALTIGFLTSGDIYARSLYQLGRICQEKNERDKAREFYRKFLAVRRSADADLPEVEDARKRLASLS
ncbi:MAG: protein kinase [Acidobacteriota bacterium]